MNLQNLVDYCKETGLPSPFSGASVPAPLSTETAINAIMVRCGLLTPCYNDPKTFTAITTIWFQRKQWTFEHLINIIEAKYSPIENVAEWRNEKTKYGHNSTRTGSYKDTEGGKDTISNSGTDTVSESGTETVAASGTDTVTASGTDTVALSGTDERDITNSGTDTTTNTISAFNSSTYQPDNKSELSHGHSVDDDITYGKSEDTTYGKSEDTTYGRSDETTFGKSVDTTHGHQQDTTYGHNVDHVYNNLKDQEGGIDEFIVSRHGNIGVTTNQQMINEELELLRHFDIYGYIAELFEEENMLMIY